MLLVDDPREQLSERSRLLIRPLSAERNAHVQAGRAARLDEGRQLDRVAQSMEGESERDDVCERRTFRIKIEYAPIWPLQAADPARPEVKRDRAEVHQIEN